jgi:hypothetical protein
MSQASLQWDEEALATLKKIPAFVRPMAKKKIEKEAIKRGIERITAELMNEVRQKQTA